MTIPANKINWFLIFIFLYSLNTTPVFPHNKISGKSFENKILSGLQEMLKFNFNKSEKIFDEIIRDYPDNPAGYHFKSIRYLWRYLDHRDGNDYNKFLALSEKVANSKIDSINHETENPFTLYVIGTSYSFRAMAFARDEDYLNAVWAAKKSYSYLTNAVLADSNFYDAYLGLGLYNFMIAQTPPALKWAMRISGIKGDKEKGIEYLRLAAKKGKFSQTEAQYYLAQILSEFYEENDEAVKMLVQLKSSYPKNILFNYSLALLYTKLSQFKKAEGLLKGIKNSNDTSFVQLKRFSVLSIGNLFFYRNDFNSAKSYYLDFLEDSSENYYRGIAAFRLGLCYTFLNDSMPAVQCFKISDKGNNDIDDDRYAKYFGEKYFNNLPDTTRQKIIIAKNLIQSAKYKDAEKILLTFDKSKVSGATVAEINLYLAEVSYQLENITQSYSYSLSVIQNDSAAKWIKAFGYYYAALSGYKLGFISDAVTFIEKIKQFSDYFYENKLENLVNALEYRLQKSLKENQ